MLCEHELHELDTLVTSALKRHVVESVGASQLSWTCLSYRGEWKIIIGSHCLHSDVILGYPPNPVLPRMTQMS